MRALVALLVMAATARADSTDVIARPLVLDRHAFQASVTLEYSLIERSVGVPLSIAPDLWFGASDALTIGLIHSNASLDRIAAGASFCVRESELYCDRGYHGSGVDARYRLHHAVAAHLRLLVRDIDPWKPALAVGAAARWTRGRFALRTDPYLRLGLQHRDQGNRAAFVVPLWFGVQPTCRWLVELHTGADGDLAVLRDGWHVPLGLAVTARATDRLDIVVEGGLSQAYGPQIDVRQRALTITASYRSH